MTLLFDTDILIDVLRARKNRRDHLAALLHQGHTLATTAMNIAEIYAGMRLEEQQLTEMFLDQLQHFPITPSIARMAGHLKYTFARQGQTLELPDLLIAATALEHKLTLVTDNRKHFPIPNLMFHALPQTQSAH